MAVMTTSTSSLRLWATRPAGKVLRLALAGTGLVFATMVLMYAAVTDTGSWMLIILGVTLAASAVRAALFPNVARLALLGVTLVAIPLSLRLF